MALTRKDKKRIAIYSLKAVSATLRTGITTANYITRFGLKAGELMASLVIGSAMSMADEICGVPYLLQWGYKMADTLEDSLVVSCKTKHTLTTRSSNHSPLYLTK